MKIIPSDLQFGHRDLWDTRHIRKRLVARQVSERQAFAYFLAVLVFDWLQHTAARLFPAILPVPDWEVASTLLTLALSVGGPLFLFWCNGGGVGQDFLRRYFVLSFVVGWKFAVASLLLSSCLPLMAAEVPPASLGWGATALLACLNVAMFLCMGWHLREMAAARPLLH